MWNFSSRSAAKGSSYLQTNSQRASYQQWMKWPQYSPVQNKYQEKKGNIPPPAINYLSTALWRRVGIGLIAWSLLTSALYEDKCSIKASALIFSGKQHCRLYRRLDSIPTLMTEHSKELVHCPFWNKFSVSIYALFRVISYLKQLWIKIKGT